MPVDGLPLEVLVATDFFTTEVWTLGGLVTYYVLFFIRLGTRELHVAGMTTHPQQAWMMPVARNITMEQWAFLSPGQYLIHDRDGKYSGDHADYFHHLQGTRPE
jgi:hypothetical protein